MTVTSTIRRLAKGAVRRAGELAVGRMGLHPVVLGYSYLSAVDPMTYVTRESQGTLEEIAPPGPPSTPLPRNIASRQELSAARGPWGPSFQDVQQGGRAGTYLLQLPRCRIVAGMDRWQNEFFAVLTADHQDLTLRGTGLVPSLHRGPLLFGRDETHETATWILESWAGNYFHWLVRHLPKVALLDQMGLSDRILLSSATVRLGPVVRRSLELFGIDVDRLPRIGPKSRTHVRELVAVSIDPYPASLLRAVRNKLADKKKRGSTGRKIYSSRAGARWRRLVNEEEDVWPLLKEAGFERVRFEQLPFDEQIELMTETGTLVGPHGAGLANMLFAPEGTCIVEIGHPAFPAPLYYALASALGHSYWLVRAEPVGDEAPKYRDLRVERSALERVIEAVGC